MNKDSFFPFQCQYCGKTFGKDPIKISIHIRENHEKGRGKLKNCR